MDPMRIGIIGCGNISEAYLKGAARSQLIAVLGVADMRPEVAQARAQEFGVQARGIDDLLADSEIELVLNLTVPAAHAPVDVQIVDAGKHAYSEKPLAVSVGEARAMMRMAAEKGVRVGCAPDTFLGAGHQACRAAIDAGRIGDVLSGAVTVMSHGMEHWHPNPEFFFKRGGGPVLDIGPYYVTQLVNLLGPVARVSAEAAIGNATRTVTSEPLRGSVITVDVPTTVSGVMAFASGALVSLSMSWDVWKHRRLPIEIYGRDGSLLNPDPNFFGGEPMLTARDGEWEKLEIDAHTVPCAEPHAALGNGGRGLPRRRAARHGGGDPRGTAAPRERRSGVARAGGAGGVRTLGRRGAARGDRKHLRTPPPRWRRAAGRAFFSADLPPVPARTDPGRASANAGARLAATDERRRLRAFRRSLRMPHEPSAWAEIGAATSPGFSRDGATIFHLRGAGLPQVWAMDRDGGNARQLSHHDEKVAFVRRGPTDERLVWGIDAGGDERQQFWLGVPGEAPRALTDAPGAIHDFGAFAPDGTAIAYAANDRDERFFDICRLDLATGETTRLHETTGTISVSGWTVHGNRIVAIADRSSSDQALWIVDAATGAAHELPARRRPRPLRLGTLDRATARRCSASPTRVGRISCACAASTRRPAMPSRCSRRPAATWMPGRCRPTAPCWRTVENDRGWGTLRVGVTGTQREAVTGLPGLAADLAWSPDGKALAFCAQGPAAPPGILAVGCDLPIVPTPIWRPDPLAEAGIAPDPLVVPELISWSAADGKTIPGWFALPKKPKPAGGFPAIVWVHGGPASQTRPNWRPDIQMLLDQGFAVLLPNVRGSTGYGRASMESDDFDKRPAAIADLVAGHAWLGRAARYRRAPYRHHGPCRTAAGWCSPPSPSIRSCGKRRSTITGSPISSPLLARHRSLATRPPGPRIRVCRDPRGAVRADIADPPRRARHRAAAGLPRQPRSAGADGRRGDQFVAAMEQHQKKVRYERFDYAGHGFIPARPFAAAYGRRYPSISRPISPPEPETRDVSQPPQPPSADHGPQRRESVPTTRSPPRPGSTRCAPAATRWMPRSPCR